MAVTVTHPFVSAIADGADATVVRPSNWNATHSISGTLDVANGGTGVTSSTGTGSTVLSALPTFAGAIVSVTDNTNAALRITQLGTGNALLVEDSTNPDSSPFVIDATGQVVVGNQTPINTIYDPQTTTARTIGFQKVGTESTTAGIAAISYSSNTGSFYSPAYYLARSKSAIKGTPGVVANNDALGSIVFSGDDGTNFVNAAQIVAAVDGTPGTNDMPGRLVFSTTADGASSPTERMRIDSSGNVAFGGTNTGGTYGQVSNQRKLTGAASTAGYGAIVNIASDVTAATVYKSQPSTEAASFVLSTLTHYGAFQYAIGAGSSITNQYGFFADAVLTGATNNYGFYGNIASGTGRYNLYMAGTAANYLAGTLTAIGGISGGTF